MKDRHPVILLLVFCACGCLLLLAWQHTPRSVRTSPRAEQRERIATASSRGSTSTEPAVSLAIRGRVLDDRGAGISRASVCVHAWNDDGWSAAEGIACTVASAAGTYEITAQDPGWWRVTASAPEFAPAAYPEPIDARPGQTLTGIDLKLRAGGARLSGRVVDALGGPVAGAEVAAESGLDRDAVVARTRTAADGAFTLWTEPLKTVTLIATATDYAPARSAWHAPADDILLVVTPGSSISGRVVLASDGSPVEGAAVRVRMAGHVHGQEDSYAESKSDGTFLATGIYPGLHELSVRSARLRSLPLPPVDVGLAQRIVDVLLQVEPAVTVQGNAVIGETDAPCRPGKAWLFDATGAGRTHLARPRETVEVRPDGRFVFEGILPGTYTLEGLCKDHKAADAPQTLQVADADLDGLRLAFKSGKSIRVSVANSAGEPLSDVWVMLKRVPYDPARPSGWAAFTGSEGHVDFGGLDAGTFRASTAKLPGVRPQQAVLGDADENGRIDLAAAGDSWIVVQVDALPGATDNRLEVHARGLRGMDDTSEQGSERISFAAGEPLGDGTYRVGPLPTGTYEVLVSDPNGPTERVTSPQGDTTIVLSAGETKALEHAMGSRAGVIRGRVLEENGSPVADAWVSATYAGDRPVQLHPQVRHIQGEKRILTDHEGRFELDGLAEHASFTVTVERPDDGARAKRDAVPAGASVEFELPAPGRLEGYVLDEAGTPAERFYIAARSTPTGARRSQLVSDPQGRFRLNEIVSGNVEIRAQTESGKVGSLQVSLAPNQHLQGLRIVMRSPAAAVPHAAQ